MAQYAALDVSQEATAICLVDEHGAVRREAKVMTCPEAIAQWLAKNATGLVRVGLETGPLAVWLWNELHEEVCPSSVWMHGMRTPRSKCGRTRRTGTTRPGWPRSFGRVGSSRSALRLERAMRSARCSPPVRFSCEFGSSWRTKSEAYFAPSGRYESGEVSRNGRISKHGNK